MAPDERDAQASAEPASITSTTATRTTAAMSDSGGHHATNLLHEAVEREQKLREEQEAQAAAQAAASASAASAAAGDSVQSDGDAQYGDVRNKNIPDLYYLFTNDKLKEEPLTQVLHSDPFVIPRLTDNVPEYRPAFNPLSILEGEEKLLPRYFRLDPYEGIPGVDKDAAAAQPKGGVARAIRVRTGSASGAGSFVVGKTTTFMGTMPRQSEFSEIPVPDSLFQTQQTFRPTPPPPPAPHPSYASKNLNIRRSRNSWSEQPAQVASASGSSSAAAAPTAAPVTPSALTDAMFLTSLHQSGSQHSDHDYYASKQTSSSIQQQQFSQAYYQQQQQQQQQGADSTAAEKLTRYLPTRSRSPPSGGAPSYTPALFLDESSSYAGDQQRHQQYQRQLHHSYQQELHSSSSSGDIQYLGSMFEDYRDSGAAGGGDDDGAMLYDNGPSQPEGDTQSLQPIPKKPRSKNVFRPCTAPGCTKGARGKSGLCQKHGGGKRCSVAGCAKGAQGSSTMCLFHGGGYRCTVEGCSTGARGTSGLCAKHGGYKRGAKEAGADGGGGGSSPTSSSNAGTGKRARTQQQQPMEIDTANTGKTGEPDGPGTPRVEDAALFS